MARDKGERWGGQSMPLTAPKALNLTVLQKAIDAIEYLMQHGGFTDCTKAQFALKMGWVLRLRNDEPDRRLVEDVCNLTRDQDQYPVAAETLGGYVISYAPSRGGMLLIDPTGEQPLHHQLHMLTGDLQKQQMIKTMNRRRLPTWKAAGEAASNTDDRELARLLWQAENEISSTGFVSDSLIAQFFQAMRTRSVLEDVS
jgi:hypothetical protein